MKQQSRTTNTLYNFISSMGGQMLTILVNFITRTVFIATLGKSYLGISGLFSNILTMLSLAEFGVGSAILFKLYDPIARKDYRRIAVLMKFYKTAYRLIGLAVTIIGLALIPFLPALIKDYDKLAALRINVPLIFCLYLLKTVSSYLFFAYRSAIIQADQKEYLINIVGYLFTLGGAIVQIVCLFLFRNFIVYVSIAIVRVIGQNFVCARMADRLYPFIREKTDESLSWTEIREILKDCSALLIYKMNNVVLKATDNIVISHFLGLETVGEYSNYYIFYTTLTTLFAKIYTSVAHSLGNLHTGGDKRHEYKIFESTMLITAILGGTAGTGIFLCSDEFVLNWIGREWLLAQPFSLLMGLEIYTLAFRIALSIYRNTMGLFQQAKYRPLAGMIINLIVSIALVRTWGICGVLVGTIIADWTTMMWFDPIIIHKYGFENIEPVTRYYGKFLKYFLIVSAAAALDWLLCTHFITGHGWFFVVIRALLCGLTTPGVLLAANANTEEGQYVLKLGQGYIRKIFRKFRH